MKISVSTNFISLEAKRYLEAKGYSKAGRKENKSLIKPKINIRKNKKLLAYPKTMVYSEGVIR